MDEPLTPEHDKAKKFASEMQAIGEFLDWLTSVRHLHIASYDVDPDVLFPMPMTDLNINKLIAEFYGIDFKAYQAEKEAVYQYVSNLANKA